MIEESILKNEIMLSILVITYQHKNYLKKTLESVFMQKTSFNSEVIIADDYSTDGTREIIKSFKKTYKDRIKLILQKKNIGATKNSYCALNMAKGKYIITIEGDDYWTDEYKLQKQVSYLENHSEYVGVFHKCKFVDENNKTLKKNYRDYYYSKENYSRKDFERGRLPGHTATFMYRNGKIDYKIIYKLHKIVGDQTIYATLLAQGNFGYIDEEMSNYRLVCKADGKNASSISAFNNYTYIMWNYYYNLEKYIKEKYHIDIDLQVQKKNQLKRAYNKLKENCNLNNLVILLEILMLEYLKK